MICLKFSLKNSLTITFSLILVASQKTQPTAEDQRSQSSLSLSRGPSTTPEQEKKLPVPKKKGQSTFAISDL